jgi:hypothetical protein
LRTFDLKHEQEKEDMRILVSGGTASMRRFAAITLGLYDWWLRYLPVASIDLADLDENRLPLALVAQDGLEDCDWDYWFGVASCLFVGGTTKFKLACTAAGLVKSAKQRGLLIHMDRVNSIKRLLYAAALGCDSVDGLQFSKFGDTYIPGAVKALMEFHGDPSAKIVQPVRRVRRRGQVAAGNTCTAPHQGGESGLWMATPARPSQPRHVRLEQVASPCPCLFPEEESSCGSFTPSSS